MTETTTTNPLNIREGDVIEYTGERWSFDKGLKQEVAYVDFQGFHFAGRNWGAWDSLPGFEYVVHYVARDGDRYLCSVNNATYTYKNGKPTFPSNVDGSDMNAHWSPGFFTSEHFTRLAPEPATPKLSVKIAPVGADLNEDGAWMDITEAIVGGDFRFTPEVQEPKTNLQWVTVDGNEVKDGEKVRIPGKLGAGFTVENRRITIAPNVSILAYSFEELEVLREVIDLPTTPGHYESTRLGITFDLDEDGNWTEKYEGGVDSADRERLEDCAPLVRILTQDEVNEQKQAALDQQKTQNEAKRKQARKRHDDYQEELLAIIRRRNEENLRLVEQVDELKRELYALRSS